MLEAVKEVDLNHGRRMRGNRDEDMSFQGLPYSFLTPMRELVIVVDNMFWGKDCVCCIQAD